MSSDKAKRRNESCSGRGRSGSLLRDFVGQRRSGTGLGSGLNHKGSRVEEDQKDEVCACHWVPFLLLDDPARAGIV